MGLRDRRLAADSAAIRRIDERGGPIRVVDVDGDPPERFRLEYRVRGLAIKGGVVSEQDRHLVEVYLTLAYPRQAPQCRMLSPVFHPNIAPHAICIGDHWSAAESLDRLVVRIAEMLCFQSYNVKSPLNAEAARWTEENLRRLPLSSEDFGRFLGEAEHADGGLSLPAPEHLVRSQPPADPSGHGSRTESDPRTALPASGGEMRGTGAMAVAPPQGTENGGWHASNPLRERRGPHQSEVPEASGRGRGEVECTSCGASLALAPGFSQDYVRCPLCRGVFRVRE